MALETAEPFAKVGDAGCEWPQPWGDAEGGDMTHPTQVPPPPQSAQPTRRWTLLATAPEWFRRIWNERSRELPKGMERDQTRIRRIAYL